MAVDGWDAAFGTARRGMGGAALAVPNVTAHLSTVVQCTNHRIAAVLICLLKGQ